ncbi:hypothetical protein AO411_2018135 [Salmonella enterica subsp. enterica serovar Sarajane]|nr:hypothetical protein AO411_2018135 [Salmonella enterica subsp. enterica serovar Sarajane]
MSTLIKNVPIAKVGKIFDGREVTRHIIERCVKNFNLKSYKPSVVFSTNESDTKGFVVALRIEGDTLFADITTHASPGTVKRWNVYPAIKYMPVAELGFPALLMVILSKNKSREDDTAIKDCDISKGD